MYSDKISELINYIQIYVNHVATRHNKLTTWHIIIWWTDKRYQHHIMMSLYSINIWMYNIIYMIIRQQVPHFNLRVLWITLTNLLTPYFRMLIPFPYAITAHNIILQLIQGLLILIHTMILPHTNNSTITNIFTTHNNSS